MRSCIRSSNTATGSIVDHDPGLYVIAPYAERDACIFYGFGFHQDSSGNKFFFDKVRRDPVQNVIAAISDVNRHHIFIGEHPCYIQISGPGDQTFFICIFIAQLPIILPPKSTLQQRRIVPIIQMSGRCYSRQKNWEKRWNCAG